MNSLKDKINDAQNWQDLAQASKALVVKLEKILKKEPSDNYFLRDTGMPEPRKVRQDPAKSIVQ